MHLDQVDNARKVFDLLRDVAEECQNWSHAMQAYEWIGRLLQQMHDFEQAIKAFKLLL